MENYRANKKIIFRQEEDEGFLFNVDTGEIKVLNSVGVLVWKELDVRNTLEQIIERIATEFDIKSKEEVKKDLEKFITQLKENNLIYVR